jgi:hypothetical protein
MALPISGPLVIVDHLGLAFEPAEATAKRHAVEQ